MVRGISGRRLRQAGLALLLAASLPWLHACTANPATGGSDFTPFMSPADEIKVGAQEHQKVLAQFGGPYQDRKIQAYVNDIGQRLAAKSELPDLKWTFTVLDSDIINAFALPGGYVYVSRGLLALADTEDQLAGVLGHEIGHVTARHSANRYSAAVGTSVGLAGASILADIFLGRGAGSLIQQTGGAAAQSFLAGYSRSQELESDALGVRYLSRIGYDPDAMASFLDKMGQESSLLAKLRNESPRGFSYLDTHPPTGERVEKATALARASGAAAKQPSREDFARRIDGLVYGDSAEQGFRRGRTFAHPKLGFTFDVPAGYFMLNFPDKLLAQGDGRSAVVFDVSPQRYQGSPDRYLTEVWAPKLRLQGVHRIRVNGLDAATGYAQARSSSGNVGVRLAAVVWPNGQIYRFQFMAPAEAFRSRDGGFVETLNSFRRLSAAEAAAFKPYRIRPYRVQSADTVESLARRLPFDDYAAERLRVLNGLGEREQVQPGSWIKMVSAR
jgi:predicted Zn-dependent protease